MRQQVLISQQPYLGSLFKSQNGTTWDPSQYEDMKFTSEELCLTQNHLWADSLMQNYQRVINEIPTLASNPITALSKKAVVGLGSALSTTPSAGLVPGVTISQFDNLNASATLINTAGVAKIGDPNAATIVNPGVGYTPSNAVLTYSNIPMVTETGEGTGIIGDVTVNNGQIGVVTFTNGGQNYAVVILLESEH